MYFLSLLPDAGKTIILRNTSIFVRLRRLKVSSMQNGTILDGVDFTCMFESWLKFLHFSVDVRSAMETSEGVSETAEMRA